MRPREGRIQARHGFSFFLPFVMRATTAALQAPASIVRSTGPTSSTTAISISAWQWRSKTCRAGDPQCRRKNVVGLQLPSPIGVRGRSRQLRPDESGGHVFDHQPAASAAYSAPGHQSAAGDCILGVGTVEKVPGGRRRCHCHTLDMLPGADLRPSLDRRRSGRQFTQRR